MKSNDKKQSYAWNMHYGSDYLSKQKAKLLRASLTEAEERLWSFVRNKKLGYKFRRQHSIGIYITDFYCHELKLAIEVDGEHHLDGHQKAWDDARTNDFKSFGIVLIRFHNKDIMDNIESVLAQIKQKCFEIS
jgi:very-short-patch-repair endonuclease